MFKFYMGGNAIFKNFGLSSRVSQNGLFIQLILTLFYQINIH